MGELTIFNMTNFIKTNMEVVTSHLVTYRPQNANAHIIFKWITLFFLHLKSTTFM